VSARKFKELEASSGAELPAAEMVEIEAKGLQAPELLEEKFIPEPKTPDRKADQG